MISRKSAITVGGRANFTIFLIFLIAGVELALASKSCKNTVMKIVMKQCSNAEMRSRRALDRIDGISRSTTNDLRKIGSENMNVFRDKVRWMNRLMLTITGLFTSMFTDTHYKMLLRTRPVKGGRRGKRYSLPDPRGDHLGLSLTTSEVDELYNEIFERPHRQPSKTPDEAKSAFLEIAAKCCQNEAECLRGKIIECP